MNEKEIIDNWLNMEQQQPVQLATRDAYWQHYRIQAAIKAMDIVKNAYNIYTEVEQLVKHSVLIADALVAELQKKGGQDE